jgi:hypothetical protein
MELEDLVLDIPGFNAWTHTGKIRWFAWFLHSHKAKDRFAVGDIRGCYEALHMERPTNISQLLADLCRHSPREVPRDSRGYYLERTVRADLTRKYGQRTSTAQVHKLLQDLPGKIAKIVEREYLDEALICFKHRAFRASVVMCWNLAFDHLCEHILQNCLADFNVALPIRFPRTDLARVATRDDFTQLRELQIVEVCRTANITSSNMTKVLREKLDKRNLAAHASGVGFNQLQAEEYITDLVNNVVLKLQ